MKWRDNPTCYSVTNLKAVNNKADDYSPVFISKKSDVLLFTGSREGALGKPDMIVGQVPEDLLDFQTRQKKALGAKAVVLGAGVNSAGSEGAAAVNKNSTRCILRVVPK